LWKPLALPHTNPWNWAVRYMCVRKSILHLFLRFVNRFRNCSANVVFFKLFFILLIGNFKPSFSSMCMSCRSLFVLFLLAIVLSVLLRCTNSDYTFGIFNLFLSMSREICSSIIYHLIQHTAQSQQEKR